MAVHSLAEAAPRLQAVYRERRLIPFLGAGFSIPLQLPSWAELMGWMGDALGFERQRFELHGTAQQLAGYYQLEQAGLEGFVAEMAREFHDPAIDARRKGSAQHQALGKCEQICIIYTTNRTPSSTPMSRMSSRTARAHRAPSGGSWSSRAATTTIASFGKKPWPLTR